LIDAVTAAAERLNAAGVAFGHGTTQAFDEAAWLVLWRLGLPLDDLEGVADQLLTADQKAAIDELVNQRIHSRRPAAYLTGEAWLQGVPFHVDERVIVPRSLIAEVLADGALEPWLADAPQQVLDLCTGNGSLAVLAAMAWPEAQVDGTDLSADALEVARLNVQRHDLQGRIRLLAGDGLAALKAHEAPDGPAAATEPTRYDLILCNPPYVNQASMQALPAEYRAEPEMALAGGPDGMDFVRPLLREVLPHLKPHGLLVLEIGHERAHFEAAFPGLEPMWLSTATTEDQVLMLDHQTLARWCARQHTAEDAGAAAESTRHALPGADKPAGDRA
jgi:ribosomal protein L3 glutamine methyltransferase